MASRSIGDFSLSFGLVSIPVKLHSATQASGGIHFNLLHAACGSRLKQQYKCVKEDVIVEREDMMKGYEFSKDQYAVFTKEELKALEEKGTHTVDIVAFVPVESIDPIYYDKAYYLAPDKRGARSYGLLLEGMRTTKRCALARWAWKGKQYTVQVRAGQDGMILQQLLYGNEVRSMKELDIEAIEVKKGELDLAVQLIEQIAVDSYDPNAYKDEFKERIETAVDQKIAGKQITFAEEPEPGGGQVIDLMAALQASLAKKSKTAKAEPIARAADESKARKSPKRTREAAAPAARARSKK